ncbi:hypothetical protein BMF94_4000 [Rhodotorula taiwanensis]|uniref:Uncharacterized protein n=1 Tax=Rhodotorula taiwanensis TaxID=741276 RepID=A0A2S5B8A9_9BASI|nr:hypothetical protein BMF94_4000 [Rhodotorula taiwanensis]
MERTSEWLPGIPSKTRGTRYFGNAVTRDLRRLREIFDQGRFRRYLVVRAWFEWVVTKGLDLYEDMDTRNKRSSADELSGFVKRVEAFAVANPNDTDTLVDMLVQTLEPGTFRNAWLRWKLPEDEPSPLASHAPHSHLAADVAGHPHLTHHPDEGARFFPPFPPAPPSTSLKQQFDRQGVRPELAERVEDNPRHLDHPLPHIRELIGSNAPPHDPSPQPQHSLGMSLLSPRRRAIYSGMRNATAAYRV